MELGPSRFFEQPANVSTAARSEYLPRRRRTSRMPEDYAALCAAAAVSPARLAHQLLPPLPLVAPRFRGTSLRAMNEQG
jgi:hypothetical protein